MKEKNIDLTTGNIYKTLIVFALPLCATYFLQLMYSTVDMAIVGKYIGETGVAAISSSSEIVNLYTFFCIGFCNGGQALIAQLIGLKNKTRFNEAIQTLLFSSLILGVVICILTISFRTNILELLNVPIESFEMAKDYLFICSFGLIFSFGYNAITICFRAFGDSKHALRFVIISTIVNIVLDYILVAYFNVGIIGAAIATLIGQMLSFVLAVNSFAKISLYPEYTYKLTDFKYNFADLKVMLKIGLPLAIQSGIVHFSMLYVNRLINNLGVSAAATFAIGIKIDDICAKTSLGFQYAGGPIVSQNFVSNNYKRVEKTIYSIWLIAGVAHIIYAVFYFVFAKDFFSLFINEESVEVLNLSSTFVRSIIWTFIPLALLRGVNALYIGIGNGKLSLYFSLLDSVVGRIGFSLLFGYVLKGGFSGFVLGYGLAPLGAVIPGILYFISGKWKAFKKLA